MASRTITARFIVKQAWWLRLYLDGVILMCGLTGCEPNWDKVQFWIKRGVRVDLERTK